ncbi:MAG TPA: hypothetical protein VMT64_08115, partial [Candidatus Binataceae bacterium]|nr:hypothetical protein [Candidatus Binataceae bacterium]
MPFADPPGWSDKHRVAPIEGNVKPRGGIAMTDGDTIERESAPLRHTKHSFLIATAAPFTAGSIRKSEIRVMERRHDATSPIAQASWSGRWNPTSIKH